MPESDLPSQSLKAGGVRRVMKNLGVLLGGRAVNAPLSLVHIWLATHLLGSYGFGLIAMMYAFARTIGDVVDFQSWQTVLQYGLRPLTDGNKREFQRIVSFSLFLDIIGGVAGLLIGVGISAFAMKSLGWPPEIHRIGILYCGSILFMAAATPTGLLRVFNRYDLLAVQGTIATIIRVIGTASMLLTGASVAILAAVWFLAEVIAWGTISVMALKEMTRRNLHTGFSHAFGGVMRDLAHRRFSEHYPRLWRFVFSTNLNSTLALAFGHIGTLVVGAFVGPASAGYYRIASQIAAGIAKPATLIQTTVYPEMARLWRDRAMGRLRRLTVQVALTAGAIGTALLLITLFAGGPLLRLYVGADGAIATLPVTLWLLAAEVVTVWGLPLEPLLFTIDRSDAAIIARCLECALFLPGLVLVVQKYGLNGVGPATLAGVTLLISIQLIFVIRTPLTPKTTG
ncbi:lipopolysaccharide biosynthesis protein [Neokomagataea anthophila]|uniref:Lipopolysaccharide biosynthesis protein n=1 Tax=Neokomagataea anthophila TaxID=2826925 RepID=A0ABS5E3L9_9PROT|nr:lipopolysaccharide biosynthesis protein [Neokomagataea anthophila]MBR0558489.1 lipopolysaccharide biosynthesis protein [Neokomagataea anthophila]